MIDWNRICAVSTIGQNNHLGIMAGIFNVFNTFRIHIRENLFLWFAKPRIFVTPLICEEGASNEARRTAGD